jgi:hypothetical protein
MHYEHSSDHFTELLYDFLDGALPQENEMSLFAALTHDAELRNEFKEQLRINTAIAEDEHAFTPPAASGEAIFARLGFATAEDSVAAAPILAAPTLGSTAIPASTLAVRAGIALRRGTALALVALLSSLLTAWLMHTDGDVINGGFGERLTGGNSTLGKNLSNHNGNAGVPPTYLSSHGTSPYPFVHADTVFQTVIRRVVVVQSPATSSLSDSHDTSPIAPPQHFSDIAHSGSFIASLTPYSIMPDSAQTPAALPLERTAPPTTPIQTTQNAPQAAPMLGLTVGARGMVSRSIIWASVPAKEAFPTNAALYALYSLSAHHSIGVEFGQESFFQRYYFTNPQGIEFRVEQHPTLIWGGLAYHYTMLPESTFTPFAHVVAGATQIGALGRGMVGVSYAPDARTQFHLGAEASSLFYQSDGAWFASPKLGVSYGVSIKF